MTATAEKIRIENHPDFYKPNKGLCLRIVGESSLEDLNAANDLMKGMWVRFRYDTVVGGSKSTEETMVSSERDLDEVVGRLVGWYVSADGNTYGRVLTTTRTRPGKPSEVTDEEMALAALDPRVDKKLKGGRMFRSYRPEGIRAFYTPDEAPQGERDEETKGYGLMDVCRGGRWKTVESPGHPDVESGALLKALQKTIKLARSPEKIARKVADRRGELSTRREDARAEQAAWIAANPEATTEQRAEACRKIAEGLGLTLANAAKAVPTLLKEIKKSQTRINKARKARSEQVAEARLLNAIRESIKK